MTDEVSILRFFETGPLEKAEVVFNIVREKMRERLRAHTDGSEAAPRDSVRKRRVRKNAEAPPEESGSASNV
jgi:hypothetical protein